QDQRDPGVACVVQQRERCVAAGHAGESTERLRAVACLLAQRPDVSSSGDSSAVAGTDRAAASSGLGTGARMTSMSSLLSGLAKWKPWPSSESMARNAAACS